MNGVFPSTASAQLIERRTVSILNKTTRVSADGSWRIDNVPVGFGPVRARAACLNEVERRRGGGQNNFGKGDEFHAICVLPETRRTERILARDADVVLESPSAAEFRRVQPADRNSR